MARQPSSNPAYSDPRYRASRKQLKTYDHTCHLCGYPIDMTLKHPHPYSWTCDHLIPRSRLHPDDSRNWNLSNMRAAHRVHNLSRGNKPLGQHGLNPSADY